MFNFFYYYYLGESNYQLPESLSSLSLENYIFIFLIFTALTPVFYSSPTSTAFSYLKHLNYFALIFIFSFLFLVTNNYFFLIFFYECLIIPVFFLLKDYGHYYRRVQAAYFILTWALLGSFFIFIGFLLFFYQLDYMLFSFFVFSSYTYWGLFFICLGFSVKVPLWPFHYWISRAHAEGPTNLSIFLSGVLVKLSIYGILKFLYLAPVKLNFTIFFYLAIIGVIDATLKMLIQIDSKVVVAFSTTVQMNLISFILFSLNSSAMPTLNLGLVNHLLTASILFFFTDQILVRFNTREFFFLTGLYYRLPALSGLLVIFIINQINFPGFIGYFLDIFFLQTSLTYNFFSAFFLFFFLFIIEHLYILFFFLKILYGVSSQHNSIYLKDLSSEEIALSIYLLSISLIFGMFPLLLSSIFVI